MNKLTCEVPTRVDSDIVTCILTRAKFYNKEVNNVQHKIMSNVTNKIIQQLRTTEINSEKTNSNPC